MTTAEAVRKFDDMRALDASIEAAHLLAEASTEAVRFSATPSTVQASGPGAAALVAMIPGAEWTEWATRSDGANQRHIEATVGGIRVWAAEVTMPDAHPGPCPPHSETP